MLVVKVLSVSLTWTHVVLVVKVAIVETGISISLMEIDCRSLILMLIPLRFVEVRYVVTLVLTHQLLVSIAVIFQLLLSMMMMTPQ